MSSNNEVKPRDQWGSKIGFILAASGSAVGLGNLWKFPFMAGQNGGGAFVLIYFAILFIVGFTLMLAELTIGRKTQLSPVGAYRSLDKRFTWVGAIGVLAGFLILSFYSVVGGWVIRYIVKAVTGAFTIADPEVLGGLFVSFITNPIEPIIYHLIFMILTLGIVIGGISGGIEKYSKILMPSLFVMMILIMIRSLTLPNAMEGVRFLLVPDFSKITGDVVLAALGQVFFSLSLGMGAMITYGSYLSKDEDLISSSVQIPLIDTAIALIAGLAILPAVFSFGFDPEGGPGLLFITLPAVFSQMPLGSVFGVIFFTLVLFAALTSSISLLEVVVSYVVDEWKWNRKMASIVLGGIIFLMGVPSSLGMGLWSDIRPIMGKDIFDSVDFIASNVFLPLGGMMLCIFIGWFWGIDKALAEITNNGKLNFALAGAWSFLIKFIAPVAILVVFIQGLGIF
ncbi:NSS family neurotransmitter:Na+ symporter [Acetoanaerobium pronyense]|uniref:Transporter n=1 Tax=Acetoanaerobium pronyense TaxID=1482736 RepID=A0ABS4KID5_9FIRM|nr:sodium-dependent transporter [Acetoanaerobium pronyense]MBP2027519.1 NSS family neurotransmitter:Na+ symporter [Acetoanaerobium pronyense]